MKDNLSNIEDQLLVMDAQDGDGKAMEQLIRRWQKRLWHYTYTLTGENQVTWDITQQSWLEIIKGLRKLNDPARFRAWAYRIVTNKAADWLKNKNRQKHLSIEAVSLDCRQENNDSEVSELMQKLKNDSRAVLSLYYFEQLNITEISDVLNVPEGTVKSRLFKAREELKKLWEKYVGD